MSCLRKVSGSHTARAHGELVSYLALGDKQAGTVYSIKIWRLSKSCAKNWQLRWPMPRRMTKSQFNVTLQQRIRDATKQLKVANSNLRALDKTKTSLFRWHSHQLGTPLGYYRLPLYGAR